MRGYEPGRFSFNEPGRPLRGVRGRRADQDRDALPARRLGHLRGLRRQALQPRDAGRPLQGPEHRRRARDDRRAGARALPQHPEDRRDPADAGRRRPRLHRARPAGDRRSPAARRSASSSPRELCKRATGTHALPARRADDRPALRRRAASCWTCCTGWSTLGNTVRRDRAQPGRHQDGRLGDRPRARRRATAAASSSPTGRRRTWPRSPRATPARYLRQVLPAPKVKKRAGGRR